MKAPKMYSKNLDPLDLLDLTARPPRFYRRCALGGSDNQDAQVGGARKMSALRTFHSRPSTRVFIRTDSAGSGIPPIGLWLVAGEFP